MELTIDQALKRGIESHKAGNFQEAERFYTAILKVQPNHADANHNMGMLAVHLSELQQAIPFLMKAIEACPMTADYWASYINTLYKLNQSETVKDALCLAKQRGISGQILDELTGVDCQKYLGVPTFISNDPPEQELQAVLDIYDRAKFREVVSKTKELLQKSPRSAVVWNMQGASLSKLAEFDEAIISFSKALQLKPEYADAHNNMGFVHKENGDTGQAIDCFRRALLIDKSHVDAMRGLGETHFANRQFAESLRYFELVISSGRLAPGTSVYKEIQARSLECLFRLNRIDEFNDKLSSIARQGEANLRVAAMSAFASRKLRQPDLYPFCKDPLSYIFLGNLRNHTSCTKDFVASLISELEMEDALWEPKGKTTRNGFQTEGNIFRRTDRHIKLLQSIVIKELRSYHRKFESEGECDLIKFWPSEVSIAGWYVKMVKGGHQDFHLHPTGWVSGVIYLKTIEEPSQNEGAIELSPEGYIQSSDVHDYFRYLHEPRFGDMIIFPSSLVHRTIPFQKDAERIVVAFDMQPPSFTESS